MDFLGTNSGSEPDLAYETLVRFAQSHSEVALRLAMHAAVPQGFRPDMLHLLKLNFIPKIGYKVGYADEYYTAEADLLLSPICRHIGSQFFEFDSEIRRLLLDNLIVSYDDGKSRVFSIANFLLRYAEHYQGFATQKNQAWRDYLEIQRWVALGFLNPDAAAEQLALALSYLDSKQNSAVHARIGSIASALSIQLIGHHELLDYAMGMEALEASQVKKAKQHFQGEWRLRAEEESWDWLGRCFEPPPDIAGVVGPRSVIVFGDPGSGKTTLKQFLIRSCYHDDGSPLRLVIEWEPRLLLSDPNTGLPVVRTYLDQIFDACALALAQHLARLPEKWAVTPNWARETLVWFVQRFVQGKQAIRLGELTDANKYPGAEIIQDLLTTNAAEVLYYPDCGPEIVIVEVAKTLSYLGLNSIWIVSEGLEAWLEADDDRLTESLKALLSTLPIFERPELVYKFIVPAQLESRMISASGMMRRRLDVYHLRWNAVLLQRLVERRLAIMQGVESFSLSQLCSAVGLLDWLKKANGPLPREWLFQVLPLVNHYNDEQTGQPIDEEMWQTLRREYPPRLYLDETRRSVTVGGKQISLGDIPPRAYEVLCYLYHHSGAVITKAKLYYHIYRGMKKIPTPGDYEYDSPQNYEGMLDNVIYRLRQAIEPEPSDPVLLTTVRGHGVRLNVRW